MLSEFRSLRFCSLAFSSYTWKSPLSYRGRCCLCCYAAADGGEVEDVLLIPSASDLAVKKFVQPSVFC